MEEREKSLAKPEEERKLPHPASALAEALRINAEALRRLDAGQRKLAETVEKGERAKQVVASTRALNETFRGLSEIQRGLLDAVVKDSGRNRGLPFAFLAIAVLAVLLGFLVYDRWGREDGVPRELYEEARRDSMASAQALADSRSREREAEGRNRDLAERLAASEQERASIEAQLAQREARVRELEQELETKNARLEQYLAVKEMADSAGAIQLRNMTLEKEMRRLQGRLEAAEKERDWLLAQLGRYKQELKERDPAEVLKTARDMGVVPPGEEPAAVASQGAQVLSGTFRRRLKRELNRLLGRAPGEEVYELLDVAAVRGGTTLLGVRVGRYRNARMLNSLSCKELEIRVDLERDTLELRFREGSITNTGQPGEKIPLGGEGHFVFLKGVGLERWLEDERELVSVDADGRLTWKTVPS